MDAMLALPPRGGRRARGRLGHARGRGDRDDRPLPQGAPGRRRRGLDRRDREGRRDDRARHGDDARLHPHRPGGAPGRAAPDAGAAVEPTFNSISIDSDTSTSDTVLLVSSGRFPARTWPRSGGPSTRVRGPAEDVVRNGEGVRHVIRVCVVNAAGLRVGPRARQGRRQRAPLQVRGRRQRPQRRPARAGHRQARGAAAPGTDLSRMRITVGGVEIFSAGAFRLDPAKEAGPGRPPEGRGALRERAAQGGRLHAARRLPGARAVRRDQDRPRRPRRRLRGRARRRPDPRVRERERRLQELTRGGPSEEPRRLRQPVPEVHRLDRLAGGALDQVVLGRGDDEVARARVEDGRHVDPVRPDDVGRVRRLARAGAAGRRAGASTPSSTRRRGARRRPGLAGHRDRVAIP